MPDQPSDEEFAYHQLVETLRLLALSAAEQVAALPDYVYVSDELALSFDDAYRMVAALEDKGRLAPGSRKVLDAIDGSFTTLTADGAGAWNEEALASDPRWQQVRRLALDALVRLGERPGPPTLDWISFAPGAGAE